MFDVVFTGGQVIDGTGSPRRPANVAIEHGLLSILAPGQVVLAEETVDARGLVLTPGFIDPHSHSDFGLIYEPVAESRISQGVTTDVIGNCGYSPAPTGDVWLTWWFLPDTVSNDFGEVISGLGGAMSIEKARRALGELGIDVTWRSMGEYMDAPHDVSVEAARCF